MKEIVDILQSIILIFILFKLVSVQGKSSLFNNQSNKINGKKLVLDSCVLIDGRILDIANAGFMPVELVIPRFILNELQMLADGQDSHKRERARFGLDIAHALQNNTANNVTVYQNNKNDFAANLPTDDKLVLTAKKLSTDLCTIDYNLNKVATIQGVQVLNINELANAIRPVALPGEKRSVKIVQKGSNKDQGVGYADDGSMIVVEGASRMVGKTLQVEVSRFIQTDAGKMLFAKPVTTPSPKRK